MNVDWLNPSDHRTIDAILDLRASIIPDGSHDREVIRSRLATIPNLARVIHERADEDRQTVEGYSVIYPLSASTVEDVVAGKIRSGGQIDLTQELPRWPEASGVYIASVAGKTRMSRITLMSDLRSTFTKSNLGWIFSRPASGDSLRIMRRIGFVPVLDEQDIWSLRYSRG